jgi:hypothetical protein
MLSLKPLPTRENGSDDAPIRLSPNGVRVSPATAPVSASQR